VDKLNFRSMDDIIAATKKVMIKFIGSEELTGRHPLVVRTFILVRSLFSKRHL